MTVYEQALNTARKSPTPLPDFELVAVASDRDRAAWADEGQVARVRARRWLWVAAAAWLSSPLLMWPGNTGGAATLSFYGTALPMALLLLWAARLSQDRRFRSGILARAIAASNLALALMMVLQVGDVGCAVMVVLAVATGRSLRLLGEHGLDGSDDPDSSFEPVQFRGVLILALIMACTDALTLSFAVLDVGCFLVYTYFFDNFNAWATVLPELGMIAVAVALMLINVWGLLHLRTWALFSNMLTNVGIAALVLARVLGSPALAILLVTTAGIQLLLPLPILAAAFGYGRTLRYEHVGAILLRVVVPLLVVATIIAAAIQVGTGLGMW